MNKSVFFGVLFGLVGFTQCAKVPLSGRRQVNLLPESQVQSLSLSAYQSFLQENKIVDGSTGNQAQLVKQVGEKLATAVTQYLNSSNLSSRVAGFNWEFNLVESNEVNAWCMPGGKVVVYTGILPLTQDELGLAVVMGHEIAHAIARHGNERMSQQLLIEAGGVGLEVLSSTKPDLTREIIRQSFGIGSNLGLLAYSRTHETEADKLGLLFMAMAGYNPEAAPGFWQRMAGLNKTTVPEWLSTHPSDETRIKNLNEFMPEALKFFQKN